MLGVRQNEISVNQNEATKQLTLVATIFLPLLRCRLLRHELRLDGRARRLVAAFAAYGLGSLLVASAAIYALVPAQRLSLSPVTRRYWHPPRCASWTASTEARSSELLARDEFFWLDLESPSAETIERSASCSRFHPLALEDSNTSGSGPSSTTTTTTCSSSTTAPARGRRGRRDAGRGSRLPQRQLHHHPSPAPLRGAGRTARTPPAPGRPSEQFVIYRVLDALTDSFFPALEGSAIEIEQLETEILDEPDRRAPAADLRPAPPPGRHAPGGLPAARPARPRHRRHPRPARPRARLPQLLPRRLRPHAPDLRT